MPDHALRYINRIAEKRTKEPDGAQLQSVAESIVVTAAGGNRAAIGVVEVEETCQLLRRWFANEAPIILGLFVGKEVHGHPFHAAGRFA